MVPKARRPAWRARIRRGGSRRSRHDCARRSRGRMTIHRRQGWPQPRHPVCAISFLQITTAALVLPRLLRHDSHDCCYVLSAGNLCIRALTLRPADQPAEPVVALVAATAPWHSCCHRKIHGKVFRPRPSGRTADGGRHVGAASVSPPREASPARPARPAVHTTKKYRLFQ